VASAKGEMFAGLPEDGVAIINRDDAFYEYWAASCRHAGQITFGEHLASDFAASDIEEFAATGTIRFLLRTPLGTVPVVLPMVGKHNVLNAAAAAAAAVSCGVDLDAVVAGLANVANVSGRLQASAGRNGMQIYDDSYNANPNSVGAAIDFLATQAEPRWLVLGDMGELGEGAVDMHHAVGVKAAESGIERLLCIGEQSRNTAAGWDSVRGKGTADWFANTDELNAALVADAQVHAGARVLVKGSRFMGLERVVAALLDTEKVD